MSVLDRLGLLDYETTEDTPPPAEPPPAEPAPEPAPEPEPEEPEAWAGPSREEWEYAQSQLAQYEQFINQLQQPSYAEPEPQGYEPLPEYDPFDPESANRYFDARDSRLADYLLTQMQQMVGPVTESYQDDQASQWADQTLGRLGVPEEDHWRDGVLFASAGFQQFDNYGRPLVHPQQAAAQGYAFLQRFAEAERAAERERLKSEGAAQDEALKARAGAPQLPTGPAGAEGVPEGMDEVAVARAWRERQIAAGP